MHVTLFGSTGLLGQEVKKTLPENYLIHCPTSQDVNLLKSIDSTSVNNLDLWINCAARVGGVKANTQFVSDFFGENIKIGSHVLDAAHEFNVKKVISVLSTCIYPDAQYVSYPLTEDQLHNGPPHSSNFGYAYAKRMLDVQSRAYRQQHNSNFITVVPNNLYGPNDNYDLNSGHVIPSLIRKFFEAHQRSSDVIIWGSGKPLREFTFAEDIAQIIWWCAKNYEGADPINVGNTEEISIADLAELIGKIFSFRGRIIFDTNKPDGQYRKPSSNKKLKDLGCDFSYTSLENGLEKTIDFFVKNYPHNRGI